MSNHEVLSAKISPPAHLLREVVIRGLHAGLKSDVEVRGNGLQEACNEAQKGNGTVLVWNHFSFRDPIEAGITIYNATDVLGTRQAGYPIAQHHYTRVRAFLARMGGVELYPLITDSAEQQGFDEANRRSQNKTFIDKSKTLLEKGGMLSIALSGTRTDHLSARGAGKVIGHFVREMNTQNFQNYGLLLMGISIPERTDYNLPEVEGLNRTARYHVVIGPYFSAQDLLKNPNVAGKVTKIDSFLKQEFVALTHPNFHTPPQTK